MQSVYSINLLICKSNIIKQCPACRNQATSAKTVMVGLNHQKLANNIFTNIRLIPFNVFRYDLFL